MTIRHGLKISKFTHIAVAGVLGLVVSPVWGQHAAPLDNNLQVGSGGRNPTVDPNINAGQAIITGNVGGLGYFRDNVGYGDAGAFRDSTGSDAQFRFEARSVPTNVNLSTGSGVQSMPVRVYRTFDSTPNNSSGGYGVDLRAGYGQSYTGSSLDVRATGSSGYSSLNAAAISSNDYGTGASLDATSLVTTSDGRLLNVSASPLLGVRVTANASDQRNLLAGQRRVGNDLETEAALAAEAAEAAEARRSELVLSGLAVDASLNREAVTVNGTDMNETVLPVFASSGAVMPTIELGERIRDQLEKSAVDPNASTDATEGETETETEAQANANQLNMERLSARIFMPLKSRQYRAGEDAYLDFLARLDPTHSRDDENPGLDTESQPGGEAPEELESPDDQTFADAERLRLDALVAAFMRGEPDDFVEGRENREDNDAGENAEDADDEATAKAPMSESEIIANLRAMESRGLRGDLDELLNLLDYDMPRMSSLAGDSETRLNKTLREAEILMASERFYDAESRYRAALSISPNHPLAQAGLVHAQMGAGMVRSAAFSLRKLFEEHPELIATKYDAKLLPAHSRLKSIRRDLEAAAKGGLWVEPALMLAYLGYQTENPRLTEYGLNLAQVRAPKDPLVVVLRRIWLEGKK